MNKIFFFFVNILDASRFMPKRIRCVIYKFLGIDSYSKTFGAECRITTKELSIGYGCYINRNVIFDNTARISIGNNVYIAMGVHFITEAHHVGTCCKRAGKNYANSIIVEDGCWIGADSIILPGVTIKHGTIIGAGSVVTHDTDSNALYCGNPAMKKKEYCDG